ncbi:MAG: CHAD domain-containing protein [Ferruginibacter sp.]
MLKKKEQEKFLHKRGDNMMRHLREFKKLQDPESLHQLRVEVKKLKGFFALAGHCTAKQKLTAEAKQVFKQAGVIRTAQLNLEFIEQYHLQSRQFKSEQESVVLIQSREFSSAATAYRKSIQKNINGIAKKIKPIHEKCIVAWYKKNIATLKQVFEKFDTSELHEGRKTIKNLLHVYPMLDKSITASLKLNIGYLEQLQEAVGKWHDVEVSYTMLIDAKLRNKKLLETFKKEIAKTLATIKPVAANFSSRIKVRAARIPKK